ncbi:uncharacterized protein LOC116847818 [Odontomachus brunneus]|uniref:uncharacterized protein LOC116847818 n=1 Tax=Odontomachus brunneus TaxID=486640 RepID=UPI0013F21B9A|nr:uncharacterized protein LOC116847818 [Odontomachus brunneus]
MIATPYLNAIQKIPGDTASEKLKWLGKLSQNEREDRQKASGDIDRMPSELQPILRVEAAVRKKIHKDITSALKSDDVTIVRRALQASWFFDGSHKDVIDVEYFREQIFPYVSVNTRLHIIKTFTLRLKDTQFAQQMFMEIENIYGIQYALPLIVVCDEEFAYRTIVNKKIRLPLTIAKKIFRRNIDFIVRYLRLSDPSEKNFFQINIQDYAVFLPTLIKKRLAAFVELYEMHEKNPPEFRLSNTCVDVFLKKGIDYLMRKPLLYIKILPIKKIHATIMKKLFPALMPENVELYDVNKAMEYLEYYPKAEKFDFLCKTYRDKYGVEFLAKQANVTPNVLLLAPVEERVKQARVMIKTELENADTTGGDDNDMVFMIWFCYLPAAESIPLIKRAIHKATTPDNRITLLWQMITTCKVNNDEKALLDFMTYFLNRHKNEEEWVFDRTMDKIASLYDVAYFSKKIWSALNEIITLFYVKYGWVTEKVLLALIHNKLLHKIPIAEQIEILIETQLKKTYVNFECLLREHPHYNRQCLIVCAEVLKQKNNVVRWKAKEDVLVFNLVKAMYYFNERYDKKKNKSSTEIKRITIQDYPWLQRILYQDVIQKSHYYSNVISNLFRKYEPDLYRSWFEEKPEFRKEYVRKGAVIKSLKQDLRKILVNWKEYLEICKTYSYKKSVHRFIRATRWYKDLPIFFVRHCQENWRQKKDCNYLVIMALLLRGDTMAKIIEPLIPMETKVNTVYKGARDNYTLVSTLPLVMKVSNPPVPLELIARLCEGDYLSVALMALTCACRRLPLLQVMSFAENLADKRVSVTKHGIRMMYLVAPIHQLQHFLQSWWQKKQHHSIRAVLLKSTQDLFFKNPNEQSWSSYKCLISTMSVTDDLLFSELNLSSVPTEYSVDYNELMFDVIHKLLAKGLPISKVLRCIVTLLQTITEQTCDNLKDSFIKMLLETYLFNQNEELSMAAINFTVSPYLLTAKGMYYTRMDTFSEILKKEVKEGWDKSHPKKSGLYPVNYSVHTFIDNFVSEALAKERQVNPDVIAKMLETFSSVLTPQMEPRSYLLLVYAHEWAKSMSPKQFGLQLGTRIHDLINIFSPMFVSFMSKTLKDLLNNIFHEKLQKPEVMHNFVEGLIEAGNMESYFIATDFLLENMPSRNPEHHTLVKKLKDMNHAGITSLLNDRKNQIFYSQVEFDVSKIE